MSRKLIFIGNPWASSKIRGEQVANRLGAEFILNGNVDPNNVFVFVKSLPEKPELFYRIYVDLIDGIGLLGMYRGLKNVSFIAISRVAKAFIEARSDNEVLFIPEHHCNFENLTRIDRPVKTVGYIGYLDRFLCSPEEVKAKMNKVGLDFIFENNFTCREDVVNFYGKIDIQLTFGMPNNDLRLPPELKNPLKLENAGSFKIPTVGYPELSYDDEFRNCYLTIKTIDEAVSTCKMLKDCPEVYNIYANRAYDRAKDYHIDKIIRLYQRIKDEASEC